MLLAIVGIGFLLTRAPVPAGRAGAWLLVGLAVRGVEWLCADEPAGFRMLAIIGALLLAMKSVVAIESRAAGGPRLSAVRWAAFALGWFGMRPDLFATLGGRPREGAAELVRLGLRRLALGLALLGLAWLVGMQGAALGESARRLVATALFMAGFSLTLHFGVFNVVAGLWRRAGVACTPLFRAPLRSRSLGEF